MKKKLLIAAIAITALASCSNDDFVGDQSLQNSSGTEGAISFTSGTPAITRATGSAAASSLNKNFVVFGFKDGSQTVFDNYQVNYVDATGSSAGSTESNSAGWEYVSYKNLPNGVGKNTGVIAFSATTSGDPNNSTAINQSIKYWDFSASTYDFIAYSLGAGATTYATASAITTSGYSLTGSQAELATCYISKQKHIGSLSTAAHEVDLEFVNFMSKIQMGFFETIPGYSVKDLRFYIADGTHSDYDTSADGEDGLLPALYGASGCISTGGTYNITFDSNYDPVVGLSGEATTSDSKVLFDVTLSSYATKEYEETVGSNFIGRTSNAATTTNQISVLPNYSGATLTLKMDYTLVSLDKTGETIEVKGATATVPAIYTAWKPNYAYTYIFKITDDKLVPITLDAIVTEAVDGSQATITTVATPSITTYQNGAIANEYDAGNIYVVVGDGSIALTAGTNAKLYTATIEEGAAQGIAADGSVAITEEQVANVLTKTLTDGKYTVTDANGKKMTVTPVSSDAADKLVGALTAIPATDAPGKKELAINCAMFTAVTNTVYVFEYIQTREQATGKYDSSKTYYTAIDGGTTVDTSAFEVGVTDVSSYYVALDASKKHYKVIKVGTPVAVTP